MAEAFQVDALDEAAIESHVAAVVKAAGRVDVTFNGITAVPQPGTQGIPIAELSADAFIAPITLYMRSHFLTARAAARRMAEQGSGVLLMNTPEPARLGLALVGGMGPAWAAMEALNRNLSAEFGAKGVRAICIRSTGMPETETIDVVFGLHADAIGITRKQFQGSRPVLLAHIGNGQKDAGERREIMAMLSCGVEVGDSTLLVRGKTFHAQNPAHRCGHTADDVLAEAGGEQRIVTVVAHGEQLLRRCGSLLGEVQRG